MKNKFRKEKINQEIKIEKIRLIGEGFKGEIVSLKEALIKSSELNLDLVLVSENNNIGVCKIMNYEKFIYELNKKPKNKVVDVKEIKIGPNTSDNDLSYRVKQMIEFLNKGHKVKITMQFRGREMVYLENGQKLMLKMIMDVQEHGIPEAMPKLEGKKLFVVIKPKNK
jgi:translation initiation factor IF-3